MSEETRILLTSDIHIGAQGPVPANVRLNTLKRIISLASSHDILIIAGDLFDSPSPGEEDLNFIYSEISKLGREGITTLFTPGKNDLLKGDMIDERILGLPFTRIFEPRSFEDPFLYEKNSEKIAFYGVPWLEKSKGLNMDAIPAEHYNVAILYSSFVGEKSDNPAGNNHVNKNDLKSTKIDFYALGSSHFFRLFKSGTRIIGAYPGTPEAVNIDETGNRFVISFSIKNRELHQIKRLAVNGVKIIESEIDCSEKNAETAIFRVLEENRSPRTLLNLKLTGERDFSFDQEEIIPYEKDYCGINIDDTSEPSMINFIETHRSEYSLRGEFFSIISERLKSETCTETASAAAEILQPMIYHDIEALEELL